MQDVADVVMAVAIAAEGQVEAWTAPAFPGSGGGSPQIVGSRAVVAASYLVVSLVLVARRRYPLGVLTLMVAAAAVPAFVYGPSQGFGQVLPFALAVYTIGAHCERRASTWGLAGCLAFIVLDQARPCVRQDHRSFWCRPVRRSAHSPAVGRRHVRANAPPLRGGAPCPC